MGLDVPLKFGLRAAGLDVDDEEAPCGAPAGILVSLIAAFPFTFTSVHQRCPRGPLGRGSTERSDSRDRGRRLLLNLGPAPWVAFTSSLPCSNVGTFSR